MHRVIPELIIENYRAGRYSGEFPAVGMFLDLSGFSTMTDVLMQHGQHGAEVLADLMHSVFDPLVESVFDYGGKIIGFAGDGVMALYPIETDVRATALRALTSAGVIQKRFKENPEHQTIYGKFAVSAKIGLAIGSASWGILRSSGGDQATYYFRGSAVDESAGAEHHAKAGDILLTTGMWKHLQNEIYTTPCDLFQRFNGFRSELPEPTRVVFPHVDLSVARLFMPEEVIAYDVRGEFRQIVNLFMRFPDLSEPQLRDLMSKVFELRNKYGGLLSRLDFGDKGCNLLMLWGAPVAYENDIGRALNFLLDLKAQVDFPITAGATYYIAHAGYLGSAMCEDYTCYGWGVNLASRFMMSAPTGAIWVDDRIARRVSKRFEIEFVGRQVFKGFAAAQKVHRLRGYRQMLEPIYQGELVGREEELAQLAHFIKPLWQKKFAGLLLVSGDAGVGKGRLVYEFRSSRLFESKKILWAVCHSDQILRQSFNPLRSWLLKYFGFFAEQSLEERRRIFDAKLDDLLASIPDMELAGELDRTRSVLAALLDMFWDGSLYEQLDAEGRYNNIFLALIALLKAESLRQPVVLCLEDFQFIDNDSKDILPRLKRAILAAEESYPIGVIVTTRPSDRSLAPDLVDARIDLRGLGREAVARLTETMLGGAVSHSLVTLLLNRSEGNAYFVEQIIRYLQEENLIEMSKDGWSLVKRVGSNFLPGDINTILVARLDQLARKVKEIIQTAAVLGREFEVQVLIQMLREDDVQVYVIEAEKAAIWAPLNEMRYIFSHGLLRDAAYEMQMRSRRQELHALAVGALEALFANELKARYAELAYHADHAGLSSKAQSYYTFAGKASADLYQNSQAIDYYTRALENTLSDDLSAQFSLLLERMELFNRLGNRGSQLEDLESLKRLARQMQDLGRLAKVDMLFAHYYTSISNYPAVVQCSERVVALNRLVEDVDVVLDTYRVWPLALLRQGRLDEAMKVAEQGRQLAQLYTDAVKEGYILNAMGLIAIEQKDPAVAHGYLERALSIAREAGNRRLESMTLGNLGNSAGYVRQDYASAREYYEQVYALMRERGERSSEAVSLGNLGWVAGMQGDLLAARSYQERALILSREVGNLYLEAYTLINLSAVTGLTDEAQTSLLYAQNALALSRKIGDRSGEAWSLLYMGYAHLLFSDFQKAEEAFRRSIVIRDELKQPGMKIEALAGLIQACSLRGDHIAALNETEKIISYLQSGNTLDGAEAPLRVYYACYLVLERTRDPRSNTLLHSAAQLLETQVSKLNDERSRQMYVENVPWRRAIEQAWQKKTA
ncbi:MAG TPA: tetratricopeptide repeat protein [Anaerolineales bacterium]|nr:tetratricopeptide repeat protein [Anaerolineales bacterium]